MKKIAFVLFASLLLSGSFTVSSQDVKKEPLVLDGIYERETIPQRVPIPYPHLRESDMMWTKRIWRRIDLREKVNHPLYYPTERMHDRISLVQRLMDAIKFNEINAYDPDIDDEFSTLLSYDQVVKRWGDDAVDREVVRQLPDGRDTTIFIKGQLRWQEVKQLLIKEEWFFDKQHSTMQVRIIGICPLRAFIKTVQTGDDEDIGGDLTWNQLFWVYYPHARTVLANTAVFNEFNDAQRISFDDIFFKRRFNSFIVRETNVYNNRLINDYTFGGIPNMQESERIRMDLFNIEHDLWEY